MTALSKTHPTASHNGQKLVGLIKFSVNKWLGGRPKILINLPSNDLCHNFSFDLNIVITAVIWRVDQLYQIIRRQIWPSLKVPFVLKVHLYYVHQWLNSSFSNSSNILFHFVSGWALPYHPCLGTMPISYNYLLNEWTRKGARSVPFKIHTFFPHWVTFWKICKF